MTAAKKPKQKVVVHFADIVTFTIACGIDMDICLSKFEWKQVTCKNCLRAMKRGK